MSTMHHQVDTKCNSPGACQITGENNLGRQTLCFYKHGGSRGRRSRVCVSVGPGLDLGKLSTKSAEDCSESSIDTSNRRKKHMTWDFQENTDVQDGKWQVMRWEDEFTTGDGTSKMGSCR